MTRALPELALAAIVGRRLAANDLLVRLPAGPDAIARAARAGLQDSMPRAALLSLHARVGGTGPDALADPDLVTVWGPHYALYTVAAADRAVFTLGRTRLEPAARARAERIADALARHLGDAEADYGTAGRALGIDPNALRYAAPTGRLLVRWDGARRPTVRVVAPPDGDPAAMRTELARRYLHAYGPVRPGAFGRWASIGAAGERAAYAALGDALCAVRTPAGAAWLLADDLPACRPAVAEPGAVRLLPSGDALTLLHGDARSLLVADPAAQARLWTSRVWPGALLLGGTVAGTWRRAEAAVRIHAWRPLARAERAAVEEEAATLAGPLACGPIRVTWADADV